MHQDTASHNLERKPRLFTAPRLVPLALIALVFSACLIQIFLPEMNVDLGNGYRLLTTDGNNPMIQDNLNHRVVVSDTIDRMVWIDDIFIGHTTQWNRTDQWFVLDTKARVVEYFATQERAEAFARDQFNLTPPFTYTSAFSAARTASKPAK